MANKKLNIVVTINQDGDDMFGDIIGVYEDFDEAIKIRDKINKGKKIPGLNLNFLAHYTSAEVITRDLNTHFKNV